MIARAQQKRGGNKMCRHPSPDPREIKNLMRLGLTKTEAIAHENSRIDFCIKTKSPHCFDVEYVVRCSHCGTATVIERVE